MFFRLGKNKILMEILKVLIILFLHLIVSGSKNQECIPLMDYDIPDFQIKSKTNEFGLEFYLAVNSCPQNKSGSNVYRCENEVDLQYQQRLPVIDDDGVLYKNKYCARCNDVFQYRIPNITAKCFKIEIEDSMSFHVHQSFREEEKKSKNESSFDVCNFFLNDTKKCHCGYIDATLRECEKVIGCQGLKTYKPELAFQFGFNTQKKDLTCHKCNTSELKDDFCFTEFIIRKILIWSMTISFDHINSVDDKNNCAHLT